MKARFPAVLAGILLAVLGSGCHREGSQVLGEAPTAAPVSLDAARSITGSETVTVTGTLIEKCPEAGCWFVLRDATGKLKVDTKTAGFVVVEVPLHRTLTVSGRLVTNGTEVLLAASGLRY